MKKREKRLFLSRETVRNLITPLKGRDLVAVAGGSCGSGESTHTGSAKVCCYAD
jgi:hypothetical protein